MSLWNGKLIEQCGVEYGVVPQNVTGTAVNSLWLSLKLYNHVAFIIQQGAWAGGTPAVTLRQASDNAGTGAKALEELEYFQQTSAGTQAASAWARTAVTSNTFNLPAAANVLTVVEVRAAELDLVNGFSFVQIQVASPGSNTDLLSILAVLSQNTNNRFPPTDPKA